MFFYVKGSAKRLSDIKDDIDEKNTRANRSPCTALHIS